MNTLQVPKTINDHTTTTKKQETNLKSKFWKQYNDKHENQLQNINNKYKLKETTKNT